MSIIKSMRENALADNDLLHKNDGQGDIFTTPRDVDFAFKTKEKDCAEALCDYIKTMNYGNPTISTDKDGVYWITVIIHMPITQHLLCSVSGFMFLLGHLFKAEYDGWGSVIHPRQPTNPRPQSCNNPHPR